MAKKQKSAPAPADDALKNVSDYRFPEATRKNNPPAKIAAEGHVPLIPNAEYLYSPRRPPELRFDPTGRADELPGLLAKVTTQKLTNAEAWALAEALRAHEPWLEWAGKREAKTFLVDPVALHIHERVSTQAILRVAAREDVNRWLFADRNVTHILGIRAFGSQLLCEQVVGRGLRRMDYVPDPKTGSIPTGSPRSISRTGTGCCGPK